MYRIDYHVHSDHSPDACDSIETLCETAVSRDIDEIAITDHLVVIPGPWFGAIDFDRQAREIADARRRFGQLTIGWGVEVSFHSGWEDSIRSVLSEYPFDLAIGSIHRVGGVDYSSPEQVSELAGRMGPVAACSPYFEAVLAAARSGLFDTIGHLDLPKRYGASFWTEWDDDMFWGPFDRILRCIVDRQIALEINTSGIRQAPGRPFPSPPVVERYRELGGRLVTVGSDCHRSEDLGRDIDVAIELAAASGLTVARYRCRELA